MRYILGKERLLGLYRGSATRLLLHEFGFKFLHTLHGYIVCTLYLFERLPPWLGGVLKPERSSGT